MVVCCYGFSNVYTTSWIVFFFFFFFCLSWHSTILSYLTDEPLVASSVVCCNRPKDSFTCHHWSSSVIIKKNIESLKSNNLFALKVLKIHKMLNKIFMIKMWIDFDSFILRAKICYSWAFNFKIYKKIIMTREYTPGNIK